MQKKNRVCHFTCAHSVNDVRVFQKECISLSQNDYEVFFVVPNAVSEQKFGVNIVGVKSFSSNPLYRLFFLSRKVYKIAREIDAEIYHFHDIELFKYGLKLKKNGKKVIFDSHEDWPQYILEITWLPILIKKILSYLLILTYRRNLKKFDKVITVSPHIVSNLSNYYSGHVDLIANYPKLDSYFTELNEKDYFNRKNIICYAGSVYRNTCQEEIIHAIQKIEDIEYFIVGKIDPDYKNMLKSIDIQSKVKFIDWLSRDELINIYRKSLIGIIIFEYTPNVGFTQGTMGNNKIFEYMSIGLPIICTNFVLWRELIIDKYKCGIAVKPKSVDDISDAIITLCNNRTIAFQMGQNGQRAVFEEFNWRTQEESLLKIYNSLI